MIRILLPIKKAKSLFVKRILRLPFAVCIDIHADSSYLLSFSGPLSRFHVPSVLRPSCRACWYCDRQILFMIIGLADIQFCAKLHRLSRFFSIIPEGSPQGHTLGRVFERLRHTEGALLPPYVSYYSPIKIRYFNGNRRALRVSASHKNPTRRWRYKNKTIVLLLMDSSIRAPAASITGGRPRDGCVRSNGGG